MKPVRKKKLVIKIIPYIFIAVPAGILSTYIHFINIHPVIVGLLAGSVAYLMSFVQVSKKYMRGKEYGTARWGTPKDIAPYMDENPDNNIILTETESLTMSSRPLPGKEEFARNKNVLVTGGSGSGKTRGFIIPNVMQCISSFPTSFVITDPKGEILRLTGSMLKRFGYKIKVVNTIDMSASMRYNPFAYVRKESDLLRLANILIENLGGKGKSSDPYWENAEKGLFLSLSGLIWTEAREDERNLAMLADIISMMTANEEGGDTKNAVDITFEQLESKNSNSFAVRQYKKFRLAPARTRNSILTQLAMRLAVYDIEETRELTAYDELDLEKLGTEKTALFVITSDTDDSYDFVPGVLYSQLFNLLCTKADTEHGGRLPVHVRFLLDEFANIGKIPNFEKLIATIRSREVSACVILQSKAQLKERYKESAATIIGNMDTEIFLGGKEPQTLKEVSEMLGKATIDIQTESRTKSQQNSSGENQNRMGRELMTIDELSRMKNTMCILQIRGAPPFYSRKYNLKTHKNYKYLGYNPKYIYDAKRHMSTRLKLSNTAKYTHVVYEVSEKGA